MGTLSTSKRILITGSSRGIGRATAVALAARGHRVVLAARDAAALAELEREIHAAQGHAEAVPMDLTDDASVEAGVAAILSRGPCDVVVNNAGACEQREFLRQSPAARRAEMELNYFGVERVTRAVLPSMIARRAGLIVNLSSLIGIVPSPTTANYSATKAALNAFSHALRGEVERYGVKITVFVVPHTDTAMGRGTRFDGVVSLPVAYTVKELLRAIDRAPRQYAGSPVYRMLIRMAGWFPAFMERRIAASVERQMTDLTLLERRGDALALTDRGGARDVRARFTTRRHNV